MFSRRVHIRPRDSNKTRNSVIIFSMKSPMYSHLSSQPSQCLVALPLHHKFWVFVHQKSLMICCPPPLPSHIISKNNKDSTHPNPHGLIFKTATPFQDEPPWAYTKMKWTTSPQPHMLTAVESHLGNRIPHISTPNGHLLGIIQNQTTHHIQRNCCTTYENERLNR